MNLTKLKWTKNVNHQGNEYWAYRDIEKVFSLHWKKGQEENAHKPREGELIVLRQRAKVTHIVKLLDNTPVNDDSGRDFSTYRRVEAVWITNNWNIVPEQNTVFDYNVRYRSGVVMQLETLPTFKANWDKRGGLKAFQNHVQKVLNLDFKELSGLQELDEIGESDHTD